MEESTVRIPSKKGGIAKELLRTEMAKAIRKLFKTVQALF